MPKRFCLHRSGIGLYLTVQFRRRGKYLLPRIYTGRFRRFFAYRTIGSLRMAAVISADIRRRAALIVFSPGEYRD